MKRHLCLLGWMGLLTVSSIAQNAWPAQPEHKLHRKVVRAERTVHFFTAWEAASEADRGRAVGLLREERGERTPEGRLPTLSALAAATRVLGGVDPLVAAGDSLQRFADAIDLQASPGVFRAHQEGRGEPITVRFYRMYDCAFREDVSLSLHWIGRDGTERRARTEHVAARHFDPLGQDLYIRAPLSEGTAWWRLVPEVEFGGEQRRGVGIEVLCTTGEPREWMEREPGHDRGELTPFLAKGFRAAGLTAGGDSHPLAGGFGPLSGVAPLPLGVEAAELAQYRREVEGLRLRAGTSPPRDIASLLAEEGEHLVFVLLSSIEECAEAPFLGPVGKAWRKLAREHRAVVCAVELPLKEEASFRRLLEGWKAAAPPGSRVRLILVASGDAATRLPFLFVGQDAGPDGLVLSTERLGCPPVLAGVPTLLLSNTDHDVGSSEGVTQVQDALSAFLRELALPRRIAAWLAADEGR